MPELSSLFCVALRASCVRFRLLVSLPGSGPLSRIHKRQHSVGWSTQQYGLTPVQRQTKPLLGILACDSKESYDGASFNQGFIPYHFTMVRVNTRYWLAVWCELKGVMFSFSASNCWLNTKWNHVEWRRVTVRFTVCFHSPSLTFDENCNKHYKVHSVCNFTRYFQVQLSKKSKDQNITLNK